MIIAAELQMQGNKHIGINYSMLKILFNSFDNNIIIYCDNFHKKEITNLEVFPNAKWNNFKYTGNKELSKINIPLKVIREVFLAFKIFFKAKRNNVRFIFFFSSYPFTQVFLNLFAFIFSQKIVLCQHGDLGVLSIQNPKILSKIFGLVQRFFFKFRSSNSIVLFYGESIKDTFFKKFPKYNSENVICIDHPYNFENGKMSKLSRKPIVVSGIGTGLINKNSQFIYKLAKFFSKEINEKKIEFKHIGNISKEVREFKNQLVNDMGNCNFLDRETFEKEISNSTFFIYFFKKDSLYDLCPSGTFFDAIKYEVPIITLNNPFFNYYFTKLGKIGWEFDNLSEIKLFLQRVINIEEENFKDLVEPIKYNLSKSKNSLSLDNIGKDFITQLLKYV